MEGVRGGWKPASRRTPPTLSERECLRESLRETRERARPPALSTVDAFLSDGAVPCSRAAGRTGRTVRRRTPIRAAPSTILEAPSTPELTTPTVVATATRAVVATAPSAHWAHTGAVAASVVGLAHPLAWVRIRRSLRRRVVQPRTASSLRRTACSRTQQVITLDDRPSITTPQSSPLNYHPSIATPQSSPHNHHPTIITPQAITPQSSPLNQSPHNHHFL